MRVKVYYKSPIIWNMVLYSFFSFAFIYFQSLYKFNTSIFDKSFLTIFIKSQWPITILMGLTLLCLLNDLRRLGLTFFVLLMGITLAITSYHLFLDFSKMPLILLFFYLVFGFYLFQFYQVEVQESYYNPLYKDSDLFSPVNKDIKVSVFDNGSEISTGIITNWSPEGCFIYLSTKIKLKGKYTVHITYLGHEFKEYGNVVAAATDMRGYGLKFKANNSMKKLQDLGWNCFYEIIDEMGYTPELLK